MQISFLAVLRSGLIAGLVSGAVNAVIFYVCRALGVFNDAIFITPNEPLSIVNVIMASLFPSLVGSVLLFFLLRYSKRGMRNFTIITVIIFMLSLVNPFVGIEGVTTSYASALDLMHLVVVFSLLYFQNRLVNKLEG